MNPEIEWLLDNQYIMSVVYVSVTVLALIVFLSIFELATKYKCWHEIKKGNVAIALATGGKIFGICYIFKHTISSHVTIYESLLWGGFGFIILLLAYLLFEFLTPVFKIDEELIKDNRAVGLIAMVISMGISFIIGTTIEVG